MSCAPTSVTCGYGMFCDYGSLTSEEQGFLDDLYRILEVLGDTALQIIQVITIKNRGHIISVSPMLDSVATAV
jgi:hypothetical protein